MNRLIKLIMSVVIISLFIIIVSCGGDSKKEPSVHGSEYLVIQHVNVGDNIDNALANKGEQIFKNKCTACHKYDSKLVGPPLGEVTKRRSPEFIMSQILAPEKMLANNDTIKSLLAKYNTSMTNQGLTQDQARAVLEHLRAVAARGGK